MSAATSSVLFKRGQTAGTTTTDPTVGYTALNIEGTEIEVDDIDLNASSAVAYKRSALGADSISAPSNRRIRLRAIRNMTGVTVYGKLLAVLARDTKFNYASGTGAPTALGGVAGSTRFRELARLGLVAYGPSRCIPLDEFLPSSGCVANDICWGVMSGPAIVKTSLANMSADITVGDALVAVTATTAAATDATTGGRVHVVDLVATTHSDNILSRVIGLAMTALLTNTTNTDCLVDVGGHMLTGG